MQKKILLLAMSLGLMFVSAVYAHPPSDIKITF